MTNDNHSGLPDPGPIASATGMRAREPWEMERPRSTRLPGFESVRPPRPTRRTDYVAARIAESLVAALNLDDFYWTPDEVSLKVWQMTQAIMAGVSMHRLIRHLQQKFGVWNIEDIDEHCCAIGQGIEDEAVTQAIAEWYKKYEVGHESL